MTITKKVFGMHRIFCHKPRRVHQANLDELEYERAPKMDLEISPKFLSNPGINIWGNPVLLGFTHQCLLMFYFFRKPRDLRPKMLSLAKVKVTLEHEWRRLTLIQVNFFSVTNLPQPLDKEIKAISEDKKTVILNTLN